MTSFPNDALEAARCHGDLSIQLCANTPDTVIHALRDLMKNLPDLLVLRWTQAGSVPVLPVVAGQPPESARNFLGFRDGSANPDSADAALMDRLVWVQPGQGEPDWASYGTYQAVRIIRNFVERWDRAPLREQELFIGREKASGAPLERRDRGRCARLRRRPRGQGHAVGRTYPAGQSADSGIGEEPDPAPAVQLFERSDQVGPARHGPSVHLLSGRSASRASSPSSSDWMASRWRSI